MADGGDVVLELSGVMKRFGGVKAVDDVSFRVSRGEFVTLLGPSGCGKTSTLRIIAGFLEPDGGRVLLQGKTVNTMPPYERDIGMVFQSYALFPHMTVAENVGFGLKMRRVGKAEAETRIDEALALVQLGGFQARYPNQLSGGQQQRVAIARALVIQPALLLMDEPMSNLDALLRAEMQLELRRIVERVGVTTINVTHNQEEALSMSDRVIVMAHGRIEQMGAPIDVYSRPRNAFVAGFLGRSNVLRCTVESNGGAMQARLASGARVTATGVEAGVGARIDLQVRPEAIEMLAPSAGGVNCFAGEVVQVAFLGAAFEYVVASEGHQFLVQAPARLQEARYRPGDAVAIRWDPAAMVSLGEAADPA